VTCWVVVSCSGVNDRSCCFDGAGGCCIVVISVIIICISSSRRRGVNIIEDASGWCSGVGGFVFIIISISSFSVEQNNAEEGLANWVLFLLVCRLILAGARRGAAFEMVVVIARGVGKELGCFSVEKGFGVGGVGSFSVEQKASKRPSKQAAKACSKAGTLLGEGLGEGVGFAGGGVLTIATVADRCGAWRRLLWGRKGNFPTGVSTVL